jgi:hypothetical protein
MKTFTTTTITTTTTTTTTTTMSVIINKMMHFALFFGDVLESRDIFMNC